MKIAANLSLLFTELPLRERVVAASAAGFDGVEIQFPYELPAIALKEALEAAGMPMRLINLPAGDLMSGGPGLASVPSRQAKFDAALQQALSYAAMVRPALVNVLPGRLAECVEPEQALACLVANLSKTAEAFQLLGIGVVVEAINPLDMPGFLINTPAQLDELLRAVGHPNLAAQYDLYHMARLVSRCWQGVSAMCSLPITRGVVRRAAASCSSRRCSRLCVTVGMRAGWQRNTDRERRAPRPA